MYAQCRVGRGTGQRRAMWIEYWKRRRGQSTRLCIAQNDERNGNDGMRSRHYDYEGMVQGEDDANWAGKEGASIPALFEDLVLHSPKIQESKPTDRRGDNLTGRARKDEGIIVSAGLPGALARRRAVARLACTERLDRGAEPGDGEPLTLGRATEWPAVELLGLGCGPLEL